MKPINKKNFEHYLIDTNGNVYSTLSQKGFPWKCGLKKLKSFPNKNTNYHMIVLQNLKAGIKPKNFYVHRLVAETYIPNPNNLPEVNHIIPDKNNNSVGNLEWLTKEQNNFHKKFFGNELNTKYTFLIEDKKLINRGLQHYKKHNDIKYLNKLWSCSEGVVRKILNNFSIKRENLRYSSNEIKKIRECILQWKRKHYTKAFIRFVKKEVGIETSYYFIRKLKNEINNL